MSQADYRSLVQHPILTMPQPVGELFFWAITAMAAFFFLWAMLRYRASGGIFLLVMVSALASCVMEGWAEFMAMNYHPEIGGRIAYQAWGMPVPIHIVLSYVLYFGAPGYFILRTVQRGMSVAAWWKLFAVNAFGVALADLVAINVGAWIYYGHQPFVVLGFPLWVMFCNAATIFAFAVIVHLCLTKLSGVARLGTIVLAPIGMSMAWAAICLPIGNALHGNAGPVLTSLAACMTAATCLALVHGSIRYFRSVAGVQLMPS